MTETWQNAQQAEASWWGSCANTYHEEMKQLEYAKRLGLQTTGIEHEYPTFDMRGKTVIDIGGGPCSLLLKCRNVRGVVIDPCPYPDWVSSRYRAAGIQYIQAPAERFQPPQAFDEAWVYNCLQHTEDPAAVAKKAMECAKLVRVWEWVYAGVNDAHPHTFTPEQLEVFFGGKGFMERNINGKDTSWYGVFAGEAK